MGTKNQRAEYECINNSDDLVYKRVRFLSKAKYMNGWMGRFRNPGSHIRTKIVTK